MIEFLVARSRYLRLASALLLLAVLGSGCGSMSLFTRKDKLEEEFENNPKYSIADVQGPAERNLSGKKWASTKEELSRNGDAATAQALAEYDAAQALYDAEKYAEAEKAFKKLAKERRETYESLGKRMKRAWGVADKEADAYTTYGDSIEEDAIFMLAESQYAQRHYAAAQNSYEELLQHYPSTRHLDPATRQLFRIARYWLGFPEDVGVNGDTEIKLVSKETKDGVPEKPDKQPSTLSRVPILPNLTDDTRPLFDTYGRAEQALRSIWLHDATGPLADDALMLAANHNLRTQDFVEARRLYALLREQYPDSPHLKDAYLLGSHVTLASYQGPEYDGRTLEDSRQLKETTLQLFGDLSPEQRKQLQQEVDLLREAEVDRLWNKVEFYQAKRMDPAMKLYCYKIINTYPESQYAEKARNMLKNIEKRELAWQKSPFNFNKQKPPAPVSAAAPTKPENESRPVEAGPNVQPEQPPEPEAQAPKRSWFNPLRRPEQLPKLQPAEDNNSESEQAPPVSPGRTRLEAG